MATLWHHRRCPSCQETLTYSSSLTWGCLPDNFKIWGKMIGPHNRNSVICFYKITQNDFLLPQTITVSSKTSGVQESQLFQLQVSFCCFSRSFHPSCVHSLTSGIPRTPCTQNLLQGSEGKQNTFHHIIHKKSAKDHETQTPSSSEATPFLHLLSLQQLQQCLHWDPRKLLSLEIQHFYIGWPIPFLQFSPMSFTYQEFGEGSLDQHQPESSRKSHSPVLWASETVATLVPDPSSFEMMQGSSLNL